MWHICDINFKKYAKYETNGKYKNLKSLDFVKSPIKKILDFDFDTQGVTSSNLVSPTKKASVFKLSLHSIYPF